MGKETYLIPPGRAVPPPPFLSTDSLLWEVRKIPGSSFCTLVSLEFSERFDKLNERYLDAITHIRQARLKDGTVKVICAHQPDLSKNLLNVLGYIGGEVTASFSKNGDSYYLSKDQYEYLRYLSYRACTQEGSRMLNDLFNVGKPTYPAERVLESKAESNAVDDLTSEGTVQPESNYQKLRSCIEAQSKHLSGWMATSFQTTKATAIQEALRNFDEQTKGVKDQERLYIMLKVICQSGESPIGLHQALAPSSSLTPTVITNVSTFISGKKPVSKAYSAVLKTIDEIDNATKTITSSPKGAP